LDVDWSQDGRLIATAGADQQVKLWNAETGEIIKSLTGWTREVTSVSFLSPATEQTAASGGDLTLRIDGAVIGKGDQFLHTMVTSPNGKWLLSGDEKGNLQLWSVDSRKLEMTFPAQGTALVSVTTGRLNGDRGL
jgi:WD40 repeat protein